MLVTGEGEKMQGGAAAFAKLIDGEISESSLAELKWNLTEKTEFLYRYLLTLTLLNHKN
ncbi:hypothetical protein ACWFN4_26280 [Bacillus mycoides]|uniref:hypothetical protein n=1 Tax=Bacillus mycoides TaxID=1405 RepID=UPI001F1DFBBA|nr:hypothetical protein [Bacillus mycoides]